MLPSLPSVNEGCKEVDETESVHFPVLHESATQYSNDHSKSDLSQVIFTDCKYA